MTRSVSDLNAITLETDSVNSSPGTTRVSDYFEICIEIFKKLNFIINRNFQNRK